MSVTGQHSRVSTGFDFDMLTSEELRMKCRYIVMLSLLVSGLAAQRRVGQSNVTIRVPGDQHEVVTGQVYVPAAGERGSDMEILQAALQNGQLQNSAMPPYRIDVSFTGGGDRSESVHANISESADVAVDGQYGRHHDSARNDASRRAVC